MQRHFTATAFVLDGSGRALLLWHKRLQRWMPPGGHVDDDEIPEDAAKRECLEETGLEVEIVGEAQDDVFADCRDEGRILKKPLAYLLENIPASASRGEPAHQHMDFVYLARPLRDDAELTLQEAEGSALRWFTRSELEALPRSEIYGNVQAYLLTVMREREG